MRNLLGVGTFLMVLPVVPAAASFGEAECAAGIGMIKAEIDKNPPAATLSKLKTALRVAEREAKEQEFDECEDAVKDANKALGRK